jgi:hypothetical protein
MNHRDTYRKFALSAPDLPLFMQPWYLDLVCEGGEWDAAIVEKGGEIAAVMPWFLKKKWGRSYITMPQLCKQMGPWLQPKYRNLKGEMRLYKSLIAQFPADLAAFRQNFNYQVGNWLPFYWAGFRQTTLYSYVLSLNRTEDEIFSEIHKNYRQKIRTAAQKTELRHDLPVAVLHELVGKSFARQSLAQPLDPAFFARFFAGLEAQGCGKLFFALDRNTRSVHAAALLAWDTGSAYYLVSGDDPALRQSGAAVLLKWEAIRFAKNILGLAYFDFEGSMMESLEQGRRDFGAEQRPYFRVEKEQAFLWKMKRFLRGGS